MICAAAEPSSGYRAGSTVPSWRRCAHARSGRNASSGCSCPTVIRRAIRCGLDACSRTSSAIQVVVEDISEALAALGCYDRQLEAIRSVFPEYGEGWRCKLVLPSLLDGDRLNLARLTVADPDGKERSSRLPPAEYHKLVAATNFKQRTRMTLEYYHADRLHFAVGGTPNLVEHDQGFFVKQGDGAADFKPIAHLYKTQVYALAEYLEVPPEIRARAAHDRHVLAVADAGRVLLLLALP